MRCGCGRALERINPQLPDAEPGVESLHVE